MIDLVNKTEHSTTGITDDGTPNGKLLGLVTSRDYRAEKDDPSTKVKEFMTPFSKLIVGEVGITLKEANQPSRSATEYTFLIGRQRPTPAFRIPQGL